MKQLIKAALVLFLVSFMMSSCNVFKRTPKEGCPTNGKNVGAEKLDGTVEERNGVGGGPGRVLCVQSTGSGLLELSKRGRKRKGQPVGMGGGGGCRNRQKACPV